MYLFILHVAVLAESYFNILQAFLRHESWNIEKRCETLQPLNRIWNKWERKWKTFSLNLVSTKFTFLGGLRVTKPTIRLACPSVCPSVRLSVCPFVCLSVNILLVNTITLQILIALGPNLYHGCISRVSWLSSKMDDLDLFLRSRG